MKHFTKKYIYYQSLTSPVSAAVLLLFCSDFYTLQDEEGEIIGIDPAFLPYLIAGFFVLCAALIIIAWLYVKMSGYELTDKEMKCKRGILYRRSSVVEYAKMHAIKKKQTFFQRLFGIAVLTVDSGSTNTAFSAEITVIETSEAVDGIIAEIRRKQAEQTEQFGAPAADGSPRPAQPAAADGEELTLYKFSSQWKLLYAFINFLGTLIVVSAVAVLALSVFAAISPLISFDPETSTADALVAMALASLLLLTSVSALMFIISALRSFVGYYGFKIFKRGDSIEIKYGLFAQNTDTFRLDKIKAVVISQGLLKRMFGYATVKLEVVGFGTNQDDQNGGKNMNTSVLLPLCRLSQIYTVLAGIIPDYIPAKREHRAKSYPAFILWSYVISVLPVGILALVALAVLSVCPVAPGVIAAVALGAAAYILLKIIIITIGKFLEYKNTGVTISPDRVTCYGGGWIRNITVIKKKDIVAMEDKTTPCRAKKNIYSYTVHFFTNAASNTVEVKNLDGSLTEPLRESVNS